MARRELWEQVDGDLYRVLGVPPTASAEAIQDAWRSAAKRTHPDRGGSADEFQGVEVAYQVLSDPIERRRYDRASGRVAAGADQWASPRPWAAGPWAAHAATDGESPGSPAGAPGRPTAFDWAAPSWAQGRGEDAGHVPQYEYDYRDPGPVTRPSLWLIALLVLFAIGLIAAVVFLAGLTLVLALMAAVALVGRLLRSSTRGVGR